MWQECANHSSAGQHRESNGFTPYLRLLKSPSYNNELREVECQGKHPEGHYSYLTTKGDKYYTSWEYDTYEEIDIDGSMKPEPEPVKLKRWEYKTESVSGMFNFALEEAGNEGWEAWYVKEHRGGGLTHTIHFKREKQND